MTNPLDAIDLHRPLRPLPFRSTRPWAGSRLGGPGEQVGELWLAGPGSIVGVAGAGETDRAGQMTLDELASAAGPSLVGGRGMRLLSARFPLLVKVIDAADWLSLQVHPDDTLAAELYGDGQLGKAEAWLVLDAEPGATLVTGPQRDLPEAALLTAIRDGVVGREHCDERLCAPGDALVLRAGTMHAIGPGTFVYEIEQPSDRTFRMSDWGRPATPDRPLHVKESLRAIRPDFHAIPAGHDWRLDGGASTVPELRLEVEAVSPAPGLARTSAGESLEIVTAIHGQATLAGDGWNATLEPYETLVVPAAVAAYLIEGPAGGLVCIGSVP